MGVLLDLYKLKVKLYIGAFRASRSSMILLAVYTLSLLPTTFGMSYVVIEAVNSGVSLAFYTSIFAVIISGFISLLLVSSLRGFTAFEFEQGFIFTSPVIPRHFLLASMFAELTAYSFFFYPAFLFLGVVAISLRLSLFVILLMISAVILLGSFIMFLKSSLSVLDSCYRQPIAKMTVGIVVALLLLPAMTLFHNLPFSYSDLPYPSTFFSQIMLSILENKTPSLLVFLGLFLFAMVSLLVFVYSSNKNVFQLANYVPFVSPFDTSMRMQSVKMEKNIKFFSKAGFLVSLDLKPGSLLGFLMKKEIVRMVRDGSLFTVLLFYAIVSVMAIAGSIETTIFPMWIFILAVYSLIVPSMLIGNWLVTERDNFWIPLTSGIKMGYIFKSLLYDMIIIALIVPVATIVFLQVISPVDPLAPLVLVSSVSMIGCSANLYVVTRFLGRKGKAAPTMIITWLSMLLSALLLSPAYIYAAVQYLLNLDYIISAALAMVVLAYAALLLRFFSRKIEKNVMIIEL